MPDRDKPIERLVAPREETRKASVLIPLDDNEALQALAKFKRVHPAPRPGRAAS
jgi:hypothetical protein